MSVDDEPQSNEVATSGASRKVVVCLACEALVAVVQHELGTDNNRDRIRNLLQDGCNHIPSNHLKGDCQSLVANHLDELIDGLSQGGHEKQVCKFAKACSRSARNFEIQGTWKE